MSTFKTSYVNKLTWWPTIYSDDFTALASNYNLSFRLTSCIDAVQAR